MMLQPSIVTPPQLQTVTWGVRRNLTTIGGMNVPEPELQPIFARFSGFGGGHQTDRRKYLIDTNNRVKLPQVFIDSSKPNGHVFMYLTADGDVLVSVKDYTVKDYT